MITPSTPRQTLLRHIHALSVQIGVRPATSEGERAAADYVQAKLTRLGFIDSQRQEFQASPRLSHKSIPAFLLVIMPLLIGLRRGRFWQIVGGLVAVIGGLNLPSLWRLRPMPWEAMLPRGESQNVIAIAPSTQKPHKKIVLLAHLDTGYHRLSAHPRFVGLFPLVADGSIIAAMASGLLSLAGLLWPLRLLGALGLGVGAGVILADELQGGIEGANDNASGIAVALGIAEGLRAEPLQHTEVWFAFTGSEQSGLGGVGHLLATQGDKLSDALFINLKMVGSGELCWATRQGLGAFGGYQPRFGLVPIAERAATARPELGVMGKPMAMIDDLSAIMDWGFSGITITGYDRVTGYSPNAHRQSDSARLIDPDTVDRALQFVAEMIRQIDMSE